MNLRLMSLACCVLLASCTSWETKKISTEDFLQQEQNSIDITEVDTYPVFESCSELSEKTVLKDCFEDFITNTLYSELSNHTIIVKESIHDTVWIDLVVDEKGQFCIEHIDLSPIVTQEIRSLPLWIHDAIRVLPKPAPATKRSMPVKTKFKVPVILKVNE
ncbi:hypothetical protein ACFO3O_22230 [Dokdonia ponticola]|uniref:TonB C-terminal domain-containing protein n=1 Tax=Dokdonia ponticola TaxID=2041041 RepID=A0ABV9I378_9FLAO